MSRQARPKVERRCPHCEEVPDPKALLFKCPECGLKGYDDCCMPGGRDCLCIECEAELGDNEDEDL